MVSTSGSTSAASTGTQPMNPGQALRAYQEQLTSYEQGEILDFPQIFFVGQGAPKIKASASPSSQLNGGCAAIAACRAPPLPVCRKQLFAEVLCWQGLTQVFNVQAAALCCCWGGAGLGQDCLHCVSCSGACLLWLGCSRVMC